MCRCATLALLPCCYACCVECHPQACFGVVTSVDQSHALLLPCFCTTCLFKHNLQAVFGTVTSRGMAKDTDKCRTAATAAMPVVRDTIHRPSLERSHRLTSHMRCCCPASAKRACFDTPRRPSLAQSHPEDWLKTPTSGAWLQHAALRCME